MIKKLFCFLVLTLFMPMSFGAGKLRLVEDAGTGDNYIELRSPAAIGTNVIFTLPTTDGTTDQVLLTDGSGGLSWTTTVAGYIDGSGTANNICKFTPDTDTVGDSNITDTGTVITLGGTTVNITATNFLINGAVIMEIPNATSIAVGGNNDIAGMGANNAVLGESAGADMSGAANVYVGKDAGKGNTSTNSGSNNVYVGFQAGEEATTASNNVLVGSLAGTAITTGGSNTFVGASAGAATQTTTLNTFIGYQAGLVNTAANNTFVGASAGLANIGGTNNSFFGFSAGDTNATGNQNTIIGALAGGGAMGNSNTIVGYAAGESTAGANNVLVGDSAGNAGAGSNSTMLGYNAGLLATGDNNVFLGYQVGNATTTGNNNIVIGYDIDTTGSTVSDEMNLGGVVFVDLNTGDVGIGTTNPGSIIHLRSETADDALSFEKYVSDANGGADIKLSKARGDIATPLIVADNDSLHDSVYSGYDGSDFESAALFIVRPDGTPGDTATDMPGSLEYYTTPDGTDSYVKRLTIRNDGKIAMGTDATPDAKLDIEGDADEVQLRIEGHTTQTSNMVEVYKSDSTTLTASLEQNGAVNRGGWLSLNKDDAQTFDGALEDIIWTEEIRKDDDYYSFTANSADITFDVAGWYRVSYSIAFDTENTSNNQRDTIRVTPEIDGTNITRARQQCYNRTGGHAEECSVSASFIVDVTAADVLQFEIDCSNEGEATHTFGGGNCDFESILDEASVVIERIDN